MTSPVDAFRAVVRSRATQEFAAAARELRQWMIAHDPHYPIYHFVGPESWINDPNGPIYYRGRYHLFYQFDPIVAGERNKRCWGHAVSEDLVHWEDWPVALWPDTAYDRNGVFSGNTFVDDDGNLCALYTGNVDGHRETYGILARSRDDGLTWEKQMVMDNAQRPNRHSPVHWDGFVWREGKLWRQLIGGAIESEPRQGAAWLWSSADLVDWRLEQNIAPDLQLGEFWELPYLFALGQKDLFMVGNGNPAWLGAYDPVAMRFHPDSPHAQSIDNGNYYSFNPNMTDRRGAQGGERRLMHGWVTGPPSPTTTVPYWQGAHSIPRVVSLTNHRVWQAPIPEIRALRAAHFQAQGLNAPAQLPIQGDALELRATFIPSGATEFGFKLCVSPDGHDFVRVYYDTQARQFGVDGPTIVRNIAEGPTPSDLRSIRCAPQPSLLDAGEAVTLHVFLDRSVVEVYANGCAYTARCFPPAGARGVELFSTTEPTSVTALDVWEMKSPWLD